MNHTHKEVYNILQLSFLDMVCLGLQCFNYILGLKGQHHFLRSLLTLHLRWPWMTFEVHENKRSKYDDVID